MGRMACTEPQCLYKDALYLSFTLSGVLVLYSQQLVFVIIVMLTSASEVRMELTSLADGNITSMTNIYSCEYSI